MPIKRLQSGRPEFPQIGVLRKGAPKSENRPGKDLEYFRFDTQDAEAEARFRLVHGEEPTSIEVYLPFHTLDENFEAWQEEYTSGALQHRCDGETCFRHLTKDGTYSDKPIPCPGGCSPVGRLKVFDPTLQRLAYIMVLTTSINDIVDLTNSLNAVMAVHGTLQNIPFVIRRVIKEKSTPGKNGKRVRRKISLLEIEVSPIAAAVHFGQLEAAPAAALLVDDSYEVVEVEGGEENGPKALNPWESWKTLADMRGWAKEQGLSQEEADGMWQTACDEAGGLVKTGRGKNTDAIRERFCVMILESKAPVIDMDAVEEDAVAETIPY